ncbi:MAG: Asp/Glu/hydantoin racemase [Ilumatobacter sp.]
MRLGLLIPSSNVVLEPLAARLQMQTPDLTIHVSRQRVLDVALDATSRSQFDLDAQVAAARLLCDAKVDRITWGGTSASWLGVEHDEAFVARMTRETEIPTTTCVLDINQRLADLGVTRLGLVTPYTDDVADRIDRNYDSLGFEVVASRNDGGTVSNEFAAIGPAAITAMIRSVATAEPEAIVVMCTNVAGAEVAAGLATELGLPILDSAAVTLSID